MVSSAISKNDRLPMGDSASQPNAQSLRNLLVGLSRFEQFPVAIQWARENHLPHLQPTASQGRLVVYFEIYRLFFINSAENVKKTTFPLSLLCMSKKITTFAADFKKYNYVSRKKQRK